MSTAQMLQQVQASLPLQITGQVDAVRGLLIYAADFPMPVNSSVTITTTAGRTPGQVVGFEGQRTLIMPLGTMDGISRGTFVTGGHTGQRIGVGPQLLGRVIDAFGKPIDGKGPIPLLQPRDLAGAPLEPMQRVPIAEPIGTGVRAVDGLLTCGLGQRMGVFSGPGVGKSTFMATLAQNTSASVSVVALIGERGREVQEFIQHTLGPEGLRKCVVVVSTGDDPPLTRIRAARAACAVAEFFRDAGQHVLLVMDSLTRLCQAQRQVGLSIGEPPATRGYTPSVFALLPELLERAGNAAFGSITGFYTVLMEGDDFNEPIADAVKGITDGHILLDRQLANRGHYPAVSVLQSISRVRNAVIDAAHREAAQRVIRLLGAYAQIEDLLNIGAYAPGGNALNDLAVRMHERITAFLQQSSTETATFADAKVQLLDLDNLISREQKALEAAGRAAAAKAPAGKK